MFMKTLALALIVAWAATNSAEASSETSEAVAYASLAGRNQGLMRACKGIPHDKVSAARRERVAALSRDPADRIAALEQYVHQLTKTLKSRALKDQALCKHVKGIVLAPQKETSPPVKPEQSGKATDYAELGRIAGRALACAKRLPDIERFSSRVLALVGRQLLNDIERETAHLSYANGLAHWYVTESYANGLAHWYVTERFAVFHKCEFSKEEFEEKANLLSTSAKAR
jgi:hypothetical protein